VLSDLPEPFTVTELDVIFRALTVVVLLNKSSAIRSFDGTFSTSSVALKVSIVVVMTDPFLEYIF